MLRTYDPKLVHVIVGGIPIGGFADKSSIKVIRSNNTFEKVEGIDGVISRSKSLNKSGEIRITLEQTSTSNDVLSGIMLTDELTNSGIIPIGIFDGGSKTVFISAFAWIRKPADTEYGKDLNQREWIFDAADIDVFIGGNSDQD
jgi:hypothetical protein